MAGIEQVSKYRDTEVYVSVPAGHSLVIPQGYANQLAILLNVAGYEGDFKAQLGAIKKGSPHSQGATSIGPTQETDNSVFLALQPGGNSTRFLCRLSCGDFTSKEVAARLRLVAKPFSDMVKSKITSVRLHELASEILQQTDAVSQKDKAAKRAAAGEGEGSTENQDHYSGLIHSCKSLAREGQETETEFILDAINGAILQSETKSISSQVLIDLIGETYGYSMDEAPANIRQKVYNNAIRYGLVAYGYLAVLENMAGNHYALTLMAENLISEHAEAAKITQQDLIEIAKKRMDFLRQEISEKSERSSLLEQEIAVLDQERDRKVRDLLGLRESQAALELEANDLSPVLKEAEDVMSRLATLVK